MTISKYVLVRQLNKANEISININIKKIGQSDG